MSLLEFFIFIYHYVNKVLKTYKKSNVEIYNNNKVEINIFDIIAIQIFFKKINMAKEQTLLQRLISFIENNKLIKMMKWSDRKLNLNNGKLMIYTRVLIKQIRIILNLISGNDLTEMLKGNFCYFQLV